MKICISQISLLSSSGMLGYPFHSHSKVYHKFQKGRVAAELRQSHAQSVWLQTSVFIQIFKNEKQPLIITMKFNVQTSQ